MTTSSRNPVNSWYGKAVDQIRTICDGNVVLKRSDGTPEAKTSRKYQEH